MHHFGNRFETVFVFFFNFQSPMKHHEPSNKVIHLERFEASSCMKLLCLAKVQYILSKDKATCEGGRWFLERNRRFLAIFNPSVLILMNCLSFLRKRLTDKSFQCWNTGNRLQNWYFQALRVSMTYMKTSWNLHSTIYWQIHDWAKCSMWSPDTGPRKTTCSLRLEVALKCPSFRSVNTL